MEKIWVRNRLRVEEWLTIFIIFYNYVNYFCFGLWTVATFTMCDPCRAKTQEKIFGKDEASCFKGIATGLFSSNNWYRSRNWKLSGLALHKVKVIEELWVIVLANSLSPRYNSIFLMIISLAFFLASSSSFFPLSFVLSLFLFVLQSHFSC